MADFITGTLILAGAVTAWAAITRAQIDAAAFSDRRAHARNAALAALDQMRVEGVAGVGSQTSSPDHDGFRLVRTFNVANLPGAAQPAGHVDARVLTVNGRPSTSGVFEVRATVTWRGEHAGLDWIELSTVVGGER